MKSPNHNSDKYFVLVLSRLCLEFLSSGWIAQEVIRPVWPLLLSACGSSVTSTKCRTTSPQEALYSSYYALCSNAVLMWQFCRSFGYIERRLQKWQRKSQLKKKQRKNLNKVRIELEMIMLQLSSTFTVTENWTVPRIADHCPLISSLSNKRQHLLSS